MSLSPKDINKKQLIYDIRKQGMTFQQIGDIVGMSRKAANKSFERFCHSKDLPEKPVIKKPVINGYWGLQIKDSVFENPILSFRDRYGYLDPPFSMTTMTRYMKKNGLVKHTREKRVPLTDEHKRIRVEFCKKQLIEIENDVDYWTRIIWTDEKYFKFREFDSQKFYYSFNKRRDLDLPKKKGQDFGIMVWGCFSFFGKGPLIRLHGKQTRHTYQQMLTDHVLEEWEHAKTIFNPIWQQDNAPGHRHPDTIDYLRSHGINHLKWPACSPDLSPIEDLWAVLVQKMAKMEKPKSEVRLQEKVMDIWDNLDPSLLKYLASKFEQKCRECVSRKGELINKFYL